MCLSKSCRRPPFLPTDRSYIVPLKRVRPPDLQLDKLHTALKRWRAASSQTLRRSVQRRPHTKSP